MTKGKDVDGHAVIRAWGKIKHGAGTAEGTRAAGWASSTLLRRWHFG